MPFGHNGPLTPEDIRALAAALGQARSGVAPCEIVCYASATAANGLADAATVAEYAAAGATWWLYGLDMQLRQPLAALLARVRQGPRGGGA